MSWNSSRYLRIDVQGLEVADEEGRQAGGGGSFESHIAVARLSELESDDRRILCVQSY